MKKYLLYPLYYGQRYTVNLVDNELENHFN